MKNHVAGDFLGELDRELSDSSRELVRHADRLTFIADLQRSVVRTALRLRRAVTVKDVIDAAPTEDERRRLTRLAQRLRSEGSDR